jgi:hypothetical protein
MITNNVDFLQRVIISMANEKYDEEVITTQMENTVIGKGKDWETKEEWISNFVLQHFNDVKLDLVNKNKLTDINQIVTPENTFALRMYSLDIGESFDFDNFNRITRFPGGWAFKSQRLNTMSFIPYDTEFKSEDGILKVEFDILLNSERVKTDA